MKQLKFLIILFSLMFITTEIMANECPRMKGMFLCPHVLTYPSFVATIHQKQKHGVTFYKYDYLFSTGDKSSAIFTASDKGEVNIVNKHKVLFRCKNNVLEGLDPKKPDTKGASTFINSKGAYQADLADGTNYITCPRIQ